MIKENQRMLNYLNVLLDGLILFFAKIGRAHV